MKFLTLNSEYIVNGSQLWRNGGLYTDDITYIGGITQDLQWYTGVPKVGDMLYVEYSNDGRTRGLRSSTITEVTI